jgi:hypothetical protein
LTQIKKFVWSGAAVSLAAFVAMAMVVGTAQANPATTTALEFTIANQTTPAGTSSDVTISWTHVSGSQATAEGALTIAGTPAAVGGSGAITNNAIAASNAVVSAATTAAATTIPVTSMSAALLATFPESGTLYLDVAGDGITANDEIVTYTGRTATSFTGVTRAQSGTTAAALTTSTTVWLATTTAVSVLPLAQNDTTMNVGDASSMVSSPNIARVIVAPGTANVENLAVTAKSGNTLTIGAVQTVAGHAVGTPVAQIIAPHRDSAVVQWSAAAATTTEASFSYVVTHDTQASTARNVALTLIPNRPQDPADSSASVSATSPTALPVLIALTGVDLVSASSGAAFTITQLPTKGTLGTITTPICATITPTPAVGEVRAQCTAQVQYTPLVGATGNDSFTYSFTNNANTSSGSGTVSIVLPGGTTGPVGGDGQFATAPMFTGSAPNITTFGGGTLVEFQAAANALPTMSRVFVQNATTGALSLYVSGGGISNNPFNTGTFATGIPAGTQVIIFQP